MPEVQNEKGEWVPAEPIPYRPNLLEKIIDHMPEFIQEWACRHFM